VGRTATSRDKGYQKQPPYATTNIAVAENMHRRSDVSIRKLDKSAEKVTPKFARYVLFVDCWLEGWLGSASSCSSD
jgi:hypothetical protein